MGLYKTKSRKLLSVDLGKTAAKIAYLEVLNGRWKLLNYDLKPVSTGRNEQESAIEFITKFVESNSIRDKDLYLNIPLSDNVIIRYLSLPALSKQEIPEAAKWQLKEEIPFDLETALLDWRIIREYNDEDGAKKNGIIFLVAKKETIDEYVSIAGRCKLNPIVINTAVFNYANLLNYFPQREPVTAILDIGNKDATLGVYNNNKLNFVRSLAFSLEKLTRSLSILRGRDKIGISLEQAQSLITTFGIPQEGNQILNDDIQAVQMISLIRPHLEALSRELKSSFDYVNSKFNIEYPSIIYLTGGGANLNNLSAYLLEKINIKTAFLPMPDCFSAENIDKVTLERDRNQIMNTLAGALKGVFMTNLLPKEIKTQKIEKIQSVSLNLIGITAGVIFFFLLLAVKFQMHDYKNRLKSARLRLQAMAPIAALQRDISFKEELISKIQKNRVPAIGLLKLISVLTPPEIVLEELSFDQASHSLILKGTVSVGSENGAEGVLIGFLKQLEESLFVTEASLMFSERNSGFQKFGIKCDLVI